MKLTYHITFSHFWATNDKPVMMVGVDIALAHQTDVPKSAKGVSNCNVFKEVDGKPVCPPSEERRFVSSPLYL